MNAVFATAFGGALGAVMRYCVVAASSRLHDFIPYGTLIVNIAGCFFIGFLMELGALKWQISNEMRAFLVTGMLGGFTTFSAFSFDFFKLVETNHVMAAASYVAASVFLSLLAVFAGVWIVRGVFA